MENVKPINIDSLEAQMNNNMYNNLLTTYYPKNNNQKEQPLSDNTLSFEEPSGDLISISKNPLDKIGCMVGVAFTSLIEGPATIGENVSKGVYDLFSRIALFEANYDNQYHHSANSSITPAQKMVADSKAYSSVNHVENTFNDYYGKGNGAILMATAYNGEAARNFGKQFGYIVTEVGLTALSGGAAVVGGGVIGFSGYGSGLSDAYQAGATDNQALINGLANAGLELGRTYSLKGIQNIPMNGAASVANRALYSGTINDADFYLTAASKSLYNNKSIATNIEEAGGKTGALESFASGALFSLGNDAIKIGINKAMAQPKSLESGSTSQMVENQTVSESIEDMKSDLETHQQASVTVDDSIGKEPLHQISDIISEEESASEPDKINVADNSFDNAVANVNPASTGTLKKLENLFESDNSIKKTLGSLKPDEQLQSNAADGLINYSDEASKKIESIRGTLLQICNDFKLPYAYYINEKFDGYQDDLLLSTDSYGHMLEFYKNDVTDMSPKLINSVNTEFMGYSAFVNDLKAMKSAKSINEILHVIHSYITNNENIYHAVPDVLTKTLANGSSVSLRGVKEPLGESIVKAIDSNLDIGDTDILTIKDVNCEGTYHYYMMVRDVGHALTLELTPTNKGYQLNYFIPKICNYDMINKLPGVSKVKIGDMYAVGEIPNSINNNEVPNAINEFIKKVPTDNDMP